jgi:hypothetical protein
MTATEVLAAWQNAAAHASEGPWVIEHERVWTEPIDPMLGAEIASMSGSRAWMSDAEFIALSRDALPRAVAALQAVLALADEVADAPRTAQWVHRNRIQDAIDAALGVKP